MPTVRTSVGSTRRSARRAGGRARRPLRPTAGGWPHGAYTSPGGGWQHIVASSPRTDRAKRSVVAAAAGRARAGPPDSSAFPRELRLTACRRRRRLLIDPQWTSVQRGRRRGPWNDDCRPDGYAPSGHREPRTDRDAALHEPRRARLRPSRGTVPAGTARAEWRTIGGRIRHCGQRSPARVPLEAPVTETLDRVKTYQQFIGGQWVDAASGETLAVENPADGTVVAHVPASGQADVDRAVDAAEAAFETWRPDDAPDPQPRAAQDRRHPRRERRRARPPRVQPDAASRSAPPSTR